MAKRTKATRRPHRRQRIPEDVIAAIRRTVAIAPIAARLTRLRPSGQRFYGLCPFHHETRPSFAVNPAEGRFYCFGCGKHGDVIDLYRHLTGRSFPAAVRALAAATFATDHTPSPAPPRPPKTAPAPDVLAALEAAADLYHRALLKRPTVRRYLEKRRIPTHLIQRHRLGYAPAGGRFLVRALSANHPQGGDHRHAPAALLRAGLANPPANPEAAPYDRFRNAIIFPLIDPKNHVIGLIARPFNRRGPHYLNSNFRRRAHLFALPQATHDHPLILVEGPADALAVRTLDLPAAAVLGNALTDDQANLLTHHPRITLAFDGDPPGRQGAARAADLLSRRGHQVRLAPLPEGHDPASLIEEGEDDVLRRLLVAEGRGG